MKKIFAVLLAVAIFAPTSAMAQYKPNQKPNTPSYNGPVTHPGSSQGGIHSQPNNGNNNNNNSHGSNNNNSGYNNGNSGHGNPGHGPAVNHELMNTHRSIERAFRTVDNSYFPIFMSKEDKVKMGRAISMLSGELNNIMRLVDRRYRDDIRNIAVTVERAKFTMFSENDVRTAYRQVQRAENLYNRVANNFFRR